MTIETMRPDDFYIHLKSYLEKYSQETIHDILREEGYTEKESVEIESDVESMLDSISSKYRSLMQAKRDGLSTEQWLRNQLDETVEKYSIDNPSQFFSDILDSASGGNVKVSRADSADFKWEGIHKNGVVKELVDLGGQAMQHEVEIIKQHPIISPNIEPIEIVKQAIDSEMDSPLDRQVKRVLTAGTVVLRDKMKNPLLENTSNEAIATYIDSGYSSVKNAWKVATGEQSAREAITDMIDRKAARACAVTDYVCKKGGEVFGRYVGQKIGGILFGPIGARVGGIIGQVVGGSVGEKVGKAVRWGVEKIADGIKAVWNKSCDLVSNAWDTFCSWFS